MGRQWLHAKRAIVNLKKGQTVGKLVKEITVAAKLGGGDPEGNARLHAAVEKAKMHLDQVVFEGYAPHKVPVIVECMTDNHQRLTPEIRYLFKNGVLGATGSNKFLFDHVGLVEAHQPDAGADLEAAAIEAGANDFEALTHAQNDDIPEGATGARFITERTAVHAVSQWLRQHGWQVVTSEIGYTAKQFPELDEAQRGAVGEFLQALEDHDDVQRVWAAVK
jgi:transcriptional/translational regulatory protein YebC/TACO1